MAIDDRTRESLELLSLRLHRKNRLSALRAYNAPRPFSYRRPRIMKERIMRGIIRQELDQRVHPAWNTGKQPLYEILRQMVTMYEMQPKIYLQKSYVLAMVNEEYEHFMATVARGDELLQCALKKAEYDLQMVAWMEQPPISIPGQEKRVHISVRGPKRAKLNSERTSTWRWSRWIEKFSLRGLARRIFGY